MIRKARACMHNPSVARRPPDVKSTRFICVSPPCSRHLLRAAPEAMALAGAALGLSLPQLPCHAAVQGDRAALWLGPDEQLLLAPEARADETSRVDRAALPDTPHALDDVGHRQTALQVSGMHARTVLNAGCPLDLHAGVFTVGACTRTVFGKAEIVLWRRGEDIFHVEVWRSFAAYVSMLLVEASRDLDS
jgi:sarcosine oxidase subunit gamma